MQICIVQIKRQKKYQWKPVLSGNETLNCYYLYVTAVNQLIGGNLPNSVLDKFLMPLGQALKDSCTDVADFYSICEITEDSKA